MKKLLITFLSICIVFLSFAQNSDTVFYKTLDSVTVLGNKLENYNISNFGKSIQGFSLILKGNKNRILFSEVPISTPYKILNIKLKIARPEINTNLFLVISQNDSVIYRKEIHDKDIKKNIAIIDLKESRLEYVSATICVGVEFRSTNVEETSFKIFIPRNKKIIKNKFLGEIIEVNGHLKIKRFENAKQHLTPSIQFELEYKQ